MGVATSIASYLRWLANAVESGSMKVEFCNQQKSIDPNSPDSLFTSLRGAPNGTEHGAVLSSWSR